MRLMGIIFFIFCFQLIASIYNAMAINQAMWGTQRFNTTSYRLEPQDVNASFYNITFDDPQDYVNGSGAKVSQFKVGGFGAVDFAVAMWSFIGLILGILLMVYTIIIQIFGASYVVVSIATAVQGVVDLGGFWGLFQILLGRGEKLFG
jgi:hypothetical protein